MNRRGKTKSKKSLTREESAVWEIMKKTHIGGDKAIDAGDLAAAVGVETRDVKELLGRLMNDHGRPIYSTEDGRAFYIKVNKPEPR